jgi:AraC-like DNA-binding protein
VRRATGDGWHVSEYVCTAGPGDRPFEERHGAATIAAVVSGTFHYRGEAGEALLHPGALMLGNAGACYECGHEHGVGDRCVALQVSAGLFEEIAASVAGTSRASFDSPMLPAIPTSLRAFVALQRFSADDEDRDSTVLSIVEQVLAAASGGPRRDARLQSRDVARIARVLRALDARPDEPADLASLAAQAGMSKYHFLRTFRRCTNVTPHQYVLRARLRAVALGLRETRRPVGELVYEAGFGDLSTFNAQFRAAFGSTPTAFRRAPRLRRS